LFELLSRVSNACNIWFLLLSISAGSVCGTSLLVLIGVKLDGVLKVYPVDWVELDEFELILFMLLKLLDWNAASGVNVVKGNSWVAVILKDGIKVENYHDTINFIYSGKSISDNDFSDIVDDIVYMINQHGIQKVGIYYDSKDFIYTGERIFDEDLINLVDDLTYMINN